jgi:hypothetical protein
MQRHPSYHRLLQAWKKVKSFFKREPDAPDDTYALVGAPKKPRPPKRHDAAAVPLD